MLTMSCVVFRSNKERSNWLRDNRINLDGRSRGMHQVSGIAGPGFRQNYGGSPHSIVYCVSPWIILFSGFFPVVIKKIT